MKVTDQLFQRFADWIQKERFPILGRTGEKTIQNELAVFLKQNRPPRTHVELEVNCRALTNGLITTKKEIDVFWEHNNTRHAIELKFHRDVGSSDSGIFHFLEDVRFGEDLIEAGFDSFGAFFATDVKSFFTVPTKPLRPRNPENLELYRKFRVERCIYGDTRLHAGKFDKTVSLKGRYPLTWNTFASDTKFTFVCLSRAITDKTSPTK